MPEPTPCRTWRTSMRRRARRVWNLPFLHRRSRARLKRQPHRCHVLNRQMVWQDD